MLGGTFVINQDRTKCVEMDSFEISNKFEKYDTTTKEKSTFEDPDNAKIIINGEEFGFFSYDRAEKIFTQLADAISNSEPLIDLSKISS